MRPWHTTFLSISLLAIPPLSAEALPAEVTALRIYTREGGVHRVLYDDLLAAGLPAGAIDSGALSLENRGDPVPVWVEDGGDGTFGSGDWFEFVSDILHGENAYFHEYSNSNAYWLSFGGLAGERMTSIPASRQPAAGEQEPHRQVWRRLHLEEDKLLVRLSGAGGGAKAGPPEAWFWAKLAHNHKQPWILALDLSDLDGASEEKVALRIHFRALSNTRGRSEGVPDHRVEVSLDGSPLAAAEWDGKTAHRLELEGLDASLFAGGSRQLELSIPRRRAPQGEHDIIDVVMLNWLEIDYPRREILGREPLHLHLGAGPDDGVVRLVSADGAEVLAYGERGSRIEASATALPGEPDRFFSFRPVAGESSYHVVPDGRLRSPERIEVDRPSDLRADTRRADYLMIAHRRLIDAIRPLAEFHRGRGLEVEVVDVQDVYDEFNHGILHPSAIRDFIAYTRDRWQRPAPRFVLLVGDASWDTKNSTVDEANYANWSDRQLDHGDRFSKKESTPYELDPERNTRQLIPTSNYITAQGHAASDNYFVAFNDSDLRPAMAIGRLPVATPEEVARIVAKTVRYASRPEVGPWRRNSLLITNESRGFQVQSDGLARQLAAVGLAPHKVYPASTEVSNEHHTRQLIEALNEGQLLVHFLGHGGRYIWRTGPPDFKKNHDLFTLDHLEELAPTGRLSVVLSLTCFSAPFDHPNADSIGEKLLRITDRGAVAVFAASWRNSPSARWGVTLFEELTAPGATVGEAVMRAKHRIGNRMFIETYNLLGDPAVPVAMPAGGIELSAGEDVAAGGPLSVRGVVDLEGFHGRILVDLVDDGGDNLKTVELETETPAFAVELAVTADQLADIRIVRAYAWDADRGVDALGAVELPRPEAEAAARAENRPAPARAGSSR
jgi:hypothetical protein